MRLVLFDLETEQRECFYPLALSRPIWDLRCGMTSLGEKWVARTSPASIAGFLPAYMEDACRETTDWPINDASVLAGDDLLLINARLKVDAIQIEEGGPSQVGLDEEGRCMYAKLAEADLEQLETSSLESLLTSAKDSLPVVQGPLASWNYIWDLILANAEQLTTDFQLAGRSGIEGTVEEPMSIRGSASDVYIAPGALVHPQVVIDAEHGPVYLDEDSEIHPFSRIEGPCYVGKKSLLLGAKCREGNSIGPVCRVGGEVEESIIHGYSNKYHDGFLGHAYVGEWVNLGAMTTNSDLKNDYSTVAVSLNGGKAIDTGSRKVGSMIGDHTKTSIGTSLNTGTNLGAMALIASTGTLLPKFIPSFAWFVEGVVTKGFGKGKLYETAATVMERRGREWTPAQQAMWDSIFELTADARGSAVKRGRRLLYGKHNK